MNECKLLLATAAVLLTLQSVSFAAPKAGTASATQNQVDGISDGKKRSLTAGSEVYSNELIRTGTASNGEFVFLDNTKLSVGPVAEVRLDSYVYNPRGNSSAVFNVTQGAFSFITGELNKRAYAIKTPYGTLGIRGTRFQLVVLRNRDDSRCGLTVRLEEGELTMTAPDGRSVELTEPNTMARISCAGVITGPEAAPTSIINFASLDGTAFAGGFAGGFSVPGAAIVGGLVIGGALVGIISNNNNNNSKPISP